MKREYPRKIYAIKHNVTGRVYIGSTGKPIQDRYCAHIRLLRRGKHSSKLMQKDFIEYGEDYTVFELGTIPSEEEREKEYEYMLKYNTGDRRYGYNQYDVEHRAKKKSIKMNFSTDNSELIRKNGLADYEGN